MDWFWWGLLAMLSTWWLGFAFTQDGGNERKTRWPPRRDAPFAVLVFVGLFVTTIVTYYSER